MRALVLAGGSANRARPLSGHLPKPLFPVLNYPVLARVLDLLATEGIRQVGITTTATSHADVFRGVAPGDMDVSWLQDEVRLGTAGSLRQHVDWLRESESVLVVHADRLTDVPVAPLVEFHRAAAARGTIAVWQVDSSAWDGDTVVTEGPYATSYQLRPGARRGRALAWSGVCILERSAIALLEPDASLDVAADILRALASRRDGLAACPFEHVEIHDFGVLPGLAHRTSVAGVAGLGLRPAGREVRPGVWVEEGTTLPESTITVPPVIIGRNVTIGPGVSLETPLSIGHEVRIGPEARIGGSLVISGSEIGAREVVRDRVSWGPADPLSVVLRYPRPSPDSPTADPSP